MGSNAFPYGESLELQFKGTPIRVLVAGGAAWFALPDILTACGYNDAAADPVNRPRFPSFGRLIVGQRDDLTLAGDESDTIALSPVGIFYWAWEIDPYRLSGVTAWARREARKLCPEADVNDPSMFLTLTEDAEGWTHIPPGAPPRYSGWKLEYEDLKWSDYAAWSKAADRNLELDIEKRAKAVGSCASLEPRFRHGRNPDPVRYAA